MDFKKPIGVMIKGHGFFYSAQLKHGPVDSWACDEFTVEHAQENDQLKFIITFKTCFGDVVIDEWSMQTLPKLAREVNGTSVLIQMLVERNIKCSASRKATIAILNVIQQPALLLNGLYHG